MVRNPLEEPDDGHLDQKYRERLRGILLRKEDESTGKLREILQLGAEWFDLEVGVLVEVDQLGETYMIDEVSTSHPDITRGLTGDLLSTYCRMVVTEEEPLAVENAPKQGWADDPAYRTSLLATYLGTEVLVDGEVYGTVCFVDMEPRDEPFDEEDRAVLELVAQAIGRILERRDVREKSPSPDVSGGATMAERRYRTALKHSPVLFAKVDEELRYEWLYNPHPDFDAEAAVGKRDDELDSGPGIDQFVDLKRRALERDEQIREEITFERSDGLITHDVTATPLREGASEEVTGLVTASLDVTERKRATRKRRQVIRRVTDAIVEVDAEWQFTLVNDQAEQLYDMTEEELLGENFWDVFEEEYRTVMETREPTRFEAYYSGLDGWFDVQVYPNEEGGISFYFREITDQKERETTLRRQKNLLEQTQRLAGGWEVDVQTGEMSWSDEVYRIHELEPDTAVSLEEAFDYYPPEGRANIREAFERCAEEGRSYDVEVPLITAKGNRRWIRAVGAPAEEEGGEVVKVAGAFQDVTERKRVEEALREERDLLRRILETSPAAIVRFDREGRFMQASDRAEEVLGLEKDEVTDRTYNDPRWKITTPEGRPMPDEELPFARVMATGEPVYDVEHAIEWPDGTRRLLSVSGAPLRDDEGRLEGAVFHIEDITERRRAENELREREDRLRGLANSIPGVVVQFYARPDGTYGSHFVSEHAESVLGIASDPDPFFERFLERVPSSHQDRFRASIEEAVGDETPWRVEVPFDRPDGERIWILSISTPQRRGEELVYNGVLLNITERKETERRLRKLEGRLRGLANSVPGGIWEFQVDPKGSYSFSFVSDSFGELLGLSSEPDSFFERFLERVPPDRRNDLLNAIDETVEQEDTFSYETPFVTPEGEWIWLWALATPERRGDTLVYHGVTIDVTERRQAERRLQEERDRFATLFHNLPTPVVHGEPDEEGRLRVRSVNAAFESVFGYAEEEVQEKDIQDLIVPPDEQSSADSIRRCLLAGEAVDREVEREAADGRRNFRVQVALRDGEGGPTEGYAIYTDITERKERERQLREAKEEAEEASRLKSAMLANMSHEVRTPLTSITGFAELLSERLEGEPAEFVRRLQQSSQRLMKTIDSVLDLSRLEAGVYELERESVRLDAVAEQTVQLLRPEADEQGVALETRLPDAPVEGLWSEGALNRIVENLVENGIKFTPEGGHIEVRLWEENGTALLEVEDTGVGISEEVLPDIFEAFKQESEGLDRTYEGSGLGLSIVQSLTERLGGTVDVTSEKGEGTCFTVRLPRATKEEGGEPAA